MQRDEQVKKKAIGTKAQKVILDPMVSQHQKPPSENKVSSAAEASGGFVKDILPINGPFEHIADFLKVSKEKNEVGTE